MRIKKKRHYVNNFRDYFYRLVGDKFFGGDMLNKKERELQAKMAAKLQADINERKTKNCIKAGANLHSQWGRVVTNEQRLIDNGHFMKSGEKAKLDYLREEVRKAKKEVKTEIRIVKKG